MLRAEELRRKAEAMELRAAQTDGANAAAYREIAAQWRLLEVEAVFMATLSAPEADGPPQDSIR